MHDISPGLNPVSTLPPGVVCEVINPGIDSLKDALLG